MTDKTRNKLNHILEAVPMSREHKNMLVEVFDEVSAGTGGGGNEPLIIELHNECYDLIINDKTFKLALNSSDISIDRKCYSPELYNILKNAIISGKNMIVCVKIELNIYIRVSYLLTDGIGIVLRSFDMGDNLQITIYNEYKDE